MKIEMRKLTEIKPYEKNPRLNDAAVDAVANSIREFGFRQPIVVDAQGVIVIGHTRWKAAQKLGLELVPVHVATELSEAQAKAYRIADNKTHQLSAWDYDKLRDEFGALPTIDWSIFGFDASELNLLSGKQAQSADDLWKGMPAFDQDGRNIYKELMICFRCEDDFKAFGILIGLELKINDKYIMWPRQKSDVSIEGTAYVDESKVSSVRDQQGAMGKQADHQGT